MRIIDADALAKDVEEECRNCFIWKGTADGELECTKFSCKAKDLKKILRDSPTVDAEPVRHGYWIEDFMDFICSECGEHSDKKTPGCPYCRSKMDKEKNHDSSD